MARLRSFLTAISLLLLFTSTKQQQQNEVVPRSVPSPPPPPLPAAGAAAAGVGARPWGWWKVEKSHAMMMMQAATPVEAYSTVETPTTAAAATTAAAELAVAAATATATAAVAAAPITTLITAEAAVKPQSPSQEEDVDEERVYHLKRCKGAGCPYTASWLSHINLYRKIAWWLESTKMETASFNIFDKAHHKFQLSDPDAYYVHHMSMFEHVLHKKYGFEVAKSRTSIMSNAAYKGECGNLNISSTTEYLSLIPFYGGLPPDVTADFSKVQSIGQGNSLVDANMKVLQCMATVCSCLRYFGQVVIGVTREDDKHLVNRMLDRIHPLIKEHTHVVQLALTKPAHLPFHLLAWGQVYVKHFNCIHGRPQSQIASSSGSGNTGINNNNNNSGSGNGDLYEICSDERLFSHHKGGPINVTYHRQSGRHAAAVAAAANGTSAQQRLHTPIRYVYYTEMDQIVRFDSLSTLHALSIASNDTTFFTGRRREKERDSEASDYMGALNNYRNCGEDGYSMSYPKDVNVRMTT